MKVIVIILSFLLLAQSMVLCSGSLQTLADLWQHTKLSQETICEATSHNMPKSCCSADAKSSCTEDSPKSNDKGCCGDDCRCFCSVKVFTQRLHVFRLSEKTDEKYSGQVNTLRNFHSFDYHPSISYPPQT
jgi:hypothetical protein